MKSILISTLGKPSAWDPVEYIHEGSSFSGRSTMPILLKNVNPRPEIAIAIVLDTVVDKAISSYDELIREVVSNYDGFFKEIGLSENLVKLIVTPGVGRFQSNVFFNFVGKLSDYYAYIMHELSKILVKADSSITIHLDLTHGINFMPSLALLAVKEIASLLALTRSVRFKVYNAEPYVKNVTTKLNIHLVEDSPAIIEYDLVPLGAEGKCALLKRHDGDTMIQDEENLRELTSKCEKMKQELNAFLSSIFNGLPLALYTFYPDVNQLESIIEGLVNIWKRNVNIKSSGNEIYIKRALSFGKDFVKLIQIWLIAKTLNLQRKTEVSYEELDYLREVFFSRLSTKIDGMISRDFYRVKESVERERCKDWTKLCVIYGESKSFSERDFLAHSGLEMNITEAKHDGKSLILRYSENEIAKVISGCMHGLIKVK